MTVAQLIANLGLGFVGGAAAPAVLEKVRGSRPSPNSQETRLAAVAFIEALDPTSRDAARSALTDRHRRRPRTYGSHEPYSAADEDQLMKAFVLTSKLPNPERETLTARLAELARSDRESLDELVEVIAGEPGFSLADEDLERLADALGLDK